MEGGSRLKGKMQWNCKELPLCCARTLVLTYHITCCHYPECHSLNTQCCSRTITYDNMDIFQDQDIQGVSIKNDTESVLEEVARIRKGQNVSNLITVVIGEYRCIVFQNLSLFRT